MSGYITKNITYNVSKHNLNTRGLIAPVTKLLLKMIIICTKVDANEWEWDLFSCNILYQFIKDFFFMVV